MLKILKRVDKDKKYKGSDGKEHTSVNYYIVTDNDVWIPFRPVFSKSYAQLDVLCETLINGK